jgi:hypothetical protein
MNKMKTRYSNESRFLIVMILIQYRQYLDLIRWKYDTPGLSSTLSVGYCLLGRKFFTGTVFILLGVLLVWIFSPPVTYFSEVNSFSLTL